MIDRCVIGMHHLNITQIGSYYDGKKHLSHCSWELDLAGSDGGIDYWFNKLPNTYWKTAGRFGNKSTGNTWFFWSCDKDGKAIPVRCADGKDRVITLAMTHSNADYRLGTIIPPEGILYQEGTAGHAAGAHIHLEIAEGCVLRKIQNAKGYWNIVGIMDARKVLFIWDKFTKVIDTKGLNFKHCDKVTVDDEGEEMIYFIAQNAPCRIREKLQFTSGKPSAKILATMPKGAKAQVTHFTERFEKDGYEWFQVKYTTPSGDIIEGYVQGDLQSYLVKKGV